MWLTPSADGRSTHLRITIRGTLGSLPHWIARPAWRVLMAQMKYRQCYEALAAVLRGDAGHETPQAGLARAAA